MAGAVDLLAGAQSIHGANLFQVDKSPLAQMSGGIQDVIGQQAATTGSSVITSFESILRAVLGFDPLEIPLEIGSELLGTVGNLGMYFGNLETFLGELNPLDPHFDPIGAAVTFIETVINPTNLLAGLVSDATGSAGLTGFIPLENLALDLIEGAIGGAQTVIDAILAAAGFPPGSGTTAEVDLLFTNLTAFLGDFTSGSFDPLTAAETFITDILNPANLLATVEDFTGLSAIVSELEAASGALIDELYNAITLGAAATGVPLGILGAALGDLAQGVQTGMTLATRAFDVTQQFGGLLHQLIDELPIVPIYQGWEHFLEQMAVVLATTVGNIFTSLSPQNPPIVAQQGQINAILAHLGTGTSGINYLPTAGIPLSANYPGTSNPSFTAPTGFSLPTVNSAPPNDYLIDSTPHFGVFTGNPSGLSGGDHGLATDRVHIEINPFTNTFGMDEIFMCGNGTTGLAQYVSLNMNNYGPIDLSIITYTGPNAGANNRVTVTLPALGPNDIVALEYDNADTYTIFLNGMAVTGGIWTDSGHVISHGAGFRECGIITAQNGLGFALTGPALKRFVAYDY